SRRVKTLLTVSLRSIAFKEAQDGVWAGQLKAPQTLALLVRSFWWPKVRDTVRDWGCGCRDCGSKKARPKETVPPLRPIRVGDCCDRILQGRYQSLLRGIRYVIVFVEYVTKELVSDCAREFVGEVVSQLLQLLQAKQSTPVPYRPNLVGLVERFNRTWKDIVSIFVDEKQTDWEVVFACLRLQLCGTR
ncbi:TPA: hypothetical protein N0F65_008078, partial [Lagenidium giganteum]